MSSDEQFRSKLHLRVISREYDSARGGVAFGPSFRLEVNVSDDTDFYELDEAGKTIMVDACLSIEELVWLRDTAISILEGMA
jgi:hypothetical protein